MGPPLIPSDILFFHILPRLQGKSVSRCLCVCKHWRSFLTTPMFANMHNHHRHHEFLIALSATTPCKFSTIDLEAPQDGLTASRLLPFEASWENVHVMASVSGLVCLRMTDTCDIFLWNPLTDEYKTVPRLGDKRGYNMATTRIYALYYSCNDYKLLIVTYECEVYIYSLKSNSWRKVETAQEDYDFFHSYGWNWGFCLTQPYVLLNEKVYFVASKTNDVLEEKCLIMIITFDLKTEKWRKIASPCIGNDLLMTWESFMVVKGCIHLYVTYQLQKDDGKDKTAAFVSELWRMDEDGDWIKVVNTYDRPFSFPPWHILCPIHLMKNGHWVMIDKYNRDIYEADLEMHTKRKVYSYYPKNMTLGKYTETLVFGD